MNNSKESEIGATERKYYPAPEALVYCFATPPRAAKARALAGMWLMVPPRL
jgi:hypothetical protein